MKTTLKIAITVELPDPCQKQLVYSVYQWGVGGGGGGGLILFVAFFLSLFFNKQIF